MENQSQQISTKDTDTDTDTVKDNDSHVYIRKGTIEADQINYIMNNQTKTSLKRLSNTEIRSSTKPKVKREVKYTKAVGVYPSVKSASRSKFKLSQHVIKWKYKRKHSYKCQVKGCMRRFNNVKRLE